MIARFLLIALVALGASACAEPLSPYQPQVDGHGYSDQRIDGRTYRVEFSGNQFTSQETVEDYLLYRAAELTLENKYDRFELSQKTIDRVVYYGPSSYPHGFGYPYSAHGGRLRRHPFQQYSPFVYPSYLGAYRETQYRATATVRFLPASAPLEGASVYDAREVKKMLDPKLERPEQGGY
jgi:hypothetical protein